MSDPFLKLAPALLKAHGKVAIYTATTAYPPDVRSVRALLTKNAQILGQYSELLELRTVAEFDARDIPAPRAGDTVLIDGKTYTVDRADQNDGYLVRVILR